MQGGQETEDDGGRRSSCFIGSWSTLSLTASGKKGPSPTKGMKRTCPASFSLADSWKWKSFLWTSLVLHHVYYQQLYSIWFQERSSSVIWFQAALPRPKLNMAAK